VVEETSIGGPAGEFPETWWSRILGAREAPERARALLEELLATYWKPLYFHARRRGLDVEAAKDAVQGFVAHLLGQDFLARLDPERGRLRSYLRTAADRYLATLREGRTAQKRGGGARVRSLDFDVAEEDLKRDASGTPESAFEREWAHEVMERALAELRGEFEAGRRTGSFDVVLRFFREVEPPSYAEAAAACGLSPTRFKMVLHRARERFRRLVRDQVARTVEDEGDVDAEIEELMRALGR